MNFNLCVAMNFREDGSLQCIHAAYGPERFPTEAEARAIVGDADARGQWVKWKKMGACEMFYYAGWAVELEARPVQQKLLEVSE